MREVSSHFLNVQNVRLVFSRIQLKSAVVALESSHYLFLSHLIKFSKILHYSRVCKIPIHKTRGNQRPSHANSQKRYQRIEFTTEHQKNTSQIERHVCRL